MPRRVCWISLALLALAPLAAAQELADSAASRGPRFLLVAALHRVPVDVSRTPVLRQRLSLDLGDVPLKVALTAIAQQSGLDLVYSDDVLPVGARVSLRAEGITVAAALTDVLADADLDVVFSRNGRAALVPRAKAGMVDSGSVRGRVTDEKTGQPIARASVALVGTRGRATTDESGQYRIAEVAAGTYSLTASRIGYGKQSQSVTVAAGQEVTLDVALQPAATQLEQVVVTGTVVPTEVKALPTPVTVIGDSEIRFQDPHTVQELFRQAVPTAVSWDYPNSPYQTTFSVRGSSTFGGLFGQMKVFVDGMETASPSQSAVDPSSIERVEVIRGPQAAAIYGSDAIGGVIQIFTRRGDPNVARPQGEAEAAVGVIQTPYAGKNGVIRQTYSGAVRGGGSDVTYAFAARYSHTGDWLPSGEFSAQSNPSVYGGMHFARGIVTADISGRYYVQNNPQVYSPDLAKTGLVYYSKPFYEPYQSQNQTFGVRLNVTPKPWWQHTVTLGLDRFGFDVAQTQPRLTTSSDTLLYVASGGQTKTLIGYNTSLEGSLGTGVSGSLTAGFDHYHMPVISWSTSGALTTNGSIQTTSAQPVGAYRSITDNTGYFTQVQLAFRDALFLTAGLRADHNSDWGDSLGTQVSPRVGISYVRQAAGATLKLRSSWGRAIRAPLPGTKSAAVYSWGVILANPLLGPERQKGWDVGADAAFGRRGSLSVTYYDQTAENLISFLLTQVGPPLTFQWQNIARVKNSGVEVEGTLNAGVLQLKGQFGYTRARIEQLAPSYAGDLQVGDQTLNTPKRTAGASLTVVPLPRSRFTLGVTSVGSWRNYDVLAEYRCFGGTGPCRPTSRDYLMWYPHFVKVNATVSQQITAFVSGFVSVDNITNRDAHEVDNSWPVMGRITTVGVRLAY